MTTEDLTPEDSGAVGDEDVRAVQPERDLEVSDESEVSPSASYEADSQSDDEAGKEPEEEGEKEELDDPSLPPLEHPDLSSWETNGLSELLDSDERYSLARSGHCDSARASGDYSSQNLGSGSITNNHFHGDGGATETWNTYDLARELPRIRAVFTPSEEIESALRVLRTDRMVTITGERGAGKRAAALHLLDAARATRIRQIEVPALIAGSLHRPPVLREGEGYVAEVSSPQAAELSKWAAQLRLRAVESGAFVVLAATPSAVDASAMSVVRITASADSAEILRRHVAYFSPENPVLPCAQAAVDALEGSVGLQTLAELGLRLASLKSRGEEDVVRVAREFRRGPSAAVLEHFDKTLDHEARLLMISIAMADGLSVDALDLVEHSLKQSAPAPEAKDEDSPIAPLESPFSVRLAESFGELHRNDDGRRSVSFLGSNKGSDLLVHVWSEYTTWRGPIELALKQMTNRIEKFGPLSAASTMSAIMKSDYERGAEDPFALARKWTVRPSAHREVVTALAVGLLAHGHAIDVRPLLREWLSPDAGDIRRGNALMILAGPAGARYPGTAMAAIQGVLDDGHWRHLMGTAAVIRAIAEAALAVWDAARLQDLVALLHERIQSPGRKDVRRAASLLVLDVLVGRKTRDQRNWPLSQAIQELSSDAALLYAKAVVAAYEFRPTGRTLRHLVQRLVPDESALDDHVRIEAATNAIRSVIYVADRADRRAALRELQALAAQGDRNAPGAQAALERLVDRKTPRTNI